MRKLLMALTLTAGLLALAGCDLEDFASSERFTDDFHYSYPLQAGGRLSVENFNGSVELTGWDENTVDISGTRYASTPEMRDSIKIDISHAPDSVYVRTVRPSDRHGNMGVRYVIKVPRNAQVDRVTSTNGAIRADGVQGPARFRTTNGQVRATNLHGNVEAQTSNGSVEVHVIDGNALLRTTNGRVHADEITGTLEAATSNGGISASVAKSDAGHPIRLETSNGTVELAVNANPQGDIRVTTTNGGITVRLPASTGARLVAHASNSSINSEFDVRSQGPVEKHHLEGDIGAGGPRVDLTTSNGSIRLLKM